MGTNSNNRCGGFEKRRLKSVNGVHHIYFMGWKIEDKDNNIRGDLTVKVVSDVDGSINYHIIRNFNPHSESDVSNQAYIVSITSSGGP